MTDNPVSDDRTQQTQAVLDTLARLGKLTVGEDSLIYSGSRFVLPETLNGDIDGGIQFLHDYKNQQETVFEFTSTFPYRPWDGANAFQRAMMRLFGTTGMGKSVHSFFGETKPQYLTVDVSCDTQIQVPWGHVEFTPLQAVFRLHTAETSEHGVVFAITVTAPRKYRPHIDAFFQIIRDELKTHSIYRGQAFTGGQQPTFLDTSTIDPERAIYTNEVMVQLDTNLWSVLRYAERMREHRIPLKRAVLVEGPYGTGKTLAGQLTAREAVRHGWTFILARPGQDDLNEVLQTAQLYAPAVVWYEDIDVLARGHSDEQISALLDALDGIANKGVEVLAGFTSNHVHKIHKGVLRPGRLDAVIHIGGLDAAGFERLVKATVPTQLLGKVDYTRLAQAFDGFPPAFAKEAIDRAMRYSISRNRGVPGTIRTDDLVHAADGLRPQLQLMHDAHQDVAGHTLDDAVTTVVERVLGRTAIVDDDGDKVGSYGLRLRVEAQH